MKIINKLGTTIPSKEKFIEEKSINESINIDYDNIIKIDPLSSIMNRIKNRENIFFKTADFIENTGGGDCYYIKACPNVYMGQKYIIFQ